MAKDSETEKPTEESSAAEAKSFPEPAEELANESAGEPTDGALCETDENADGISDGETEETDEVSDEKAAQPDPDRKKKRVALIVILSLLLAFAIALPLTLINYSDLRSVFIPANNEKILYMSADAGDIWKNEEYMSSAVQKTVRAETGDNLIDRSFSDLSSALAAFSDLEKLPYGGEVLGRYFAALISGVDGSESFAQLFDSSFAGIVPKFFYPQKLSNVYLYCVERGEDESTWEVRFSILNNDGMAVNYLPTRDSGSARFRLVFSGKSWKIAEIATVYPMN